MKKLLFVMPTMMVAGAEKSLLALLQELDKTKYSIDLLLFAKRGELLEELPPEINVYEVDKVTRAMIMEARYYFKDLVQGGRIFSAVQRACVTVVDHLNTKFNKVILNQWNFQRGSIKPWGKEYDVAVSFLEGSTNYFCIEKVCARKKIGWVHRDYAAKPFDKQFDLRMFSQFDAVATISEKCLEILQFEFPSIADKFMLIPNIVSRDYVENQAKKASEVDGWSHDIKHLVTVGRLTYQKGVDIAIDAAALLKEQGVPFFWHFYGEGSDRSVLENQIAEKGVTDCCALEGIRKNPYPFMKKADLIIQPSRYEGKSLVLDEARFLRKVIVATNYSSVCDQLTQNETGIICQMTPEGLAEAIQNILQDSQLQEVIWRNLEMTACDVSKEVLTKFEKLVGE